MGEKEYSGMLTAVCSLTQMKILLLVVLWQFVELYIHILCTFLYGHDIHNKKGFFLSSAVLKGSIIQGI